MPSAEDTRIRAATEGDVALLHRLICELAEYEKLADAVAGDEQTLRRTLFELRAAEALILEAGDEVVGYAIFFTTFSSFEMRPGIWLEDVYVRPAHRRAGLGKAVMEHLARLVLERDCARLDWCALDWNEPALRFYDELGARRLDEWRMLRLELPEIRALAGKSDPAGR